MTILEARVVKHHYASWSWIFTRSFSKLQTSKWCRDESGYLGISRVSRSTKKIKKKGRRPFQENIQRKHLLEREFYQKLDFGKWGSIYELDYLQILFPWVRCCDQYSNLKNKLKSKDYLYNNRQDVNRYEDWQLFVSLVFPFFAFKDRRSLSWIYESSWDNKTIQSWILFIRRLSFLLVFIRDLDSARGENPCYSPIMVRRFMIHYIAKGCWFVRYGQCLNEKASFMVLILWFVKWIVRTFIWL